MTTQKEFAAMPKEDANFTISDITVDHSSVSKAELLKAWNWLVPEELELIFVTVFGDAFLINPENTEVFFLDTVDGDLEPISENLEAFTELLADNSEFIRDYFSIAPWILHKDEILDGQPMPKGMVFNYLTPFALGGEAELDNIALFPLQEHFDMSGEFWDKMQTLEKEVAKDLLTVEAEEIEKPQDSDKQ